MGDHLRKRRLGLKLLQKEVAQKLSVDEASVWNWENNRTSPSLHLIPKIIEFLNYVPSNNLPKTFGDKIINIRRLFGITQKELAHRLGIDPTTLGRWEKGKSRPLKRRLKKLNSYIISLSPAGEGPEE